MQRLALFFALLLAACGDEPEPPGPEPLFPSGFETSYAEVRNCRFSIEHDGVSIIVYASPGAAEAYREGRYPFAPGAVIVKKEHRDGSCTELSGYTVMKKTGTGSSAADWSWQRVGADRKVDTEAPAQRCIACHAGCTEGRDQTCTDP